MQDLDPAWDQTWIFFTVRNFHKKDGNHNFERISIWRGFIGGIMDMLKMLLQLEIIVRICRTVAGMGWIDPLNFCLSLALNWFR